MRQFTDAVLLAIAELDHKCIEPAATLKYEPFVQNWVLRYMNENTKRSAESIPMLYIHFPLPFPDTSGIS